MNVTIPASGQYGYLADAAAQELPPNAWSYARNMRFRDGYAERMAGASPVLTTPLITPYWITSYRNGNAKFWVYTGAAGAYVDDGATQTALGTPFTGSADDRFTGGSASGVLVVNNGVNVPQFWGGDTGTPFANLTAWDTNWRAASIRPFKNFLVAVDITKTATRYANMVKWSSAAVPGALPASWDESDPTVEAGEVDLAETTDFLIDQLVMGDINVVYKERSMYGMQFVGGTSVFRFWRLPGDAGMLARGCVANTPAGHVVLTSGDLVTHSGQGPKSIISGRMRKWLFSNLDTANYQRAFLCVNQLANEVWTCFPEPGASACTLALAWNWKDDTIGVRELSNVTFGASGPVVSAGNTTWASDTETWSDDATSWGNDGYAATESRLLLTQTTPLISLDGAGFTFNGTLPTCILERTGLTLEKPDTVKTIRSVVPRVDALAGTVLSIEVGGSMDAETAPTWSGVVTYTVGTTRKADCMATGRFLSLRITSMGAEPWRIKSIDLDVELRGMY